jgi:sterol desaturase/sphingolipid hydroxylase (fatty acid hydroxylase superfamily)
MTIILILLGIVTWTLVEYWLHRTLGHKPGKNPFTKEHLKHHFIKNYFAPKSEKLKAAVIVVLLIGILTRSPAYSISFTLTYLYYEYVHFSLHVKNGKTMIGKYLRRHHFYHHFEDKQKNHGVTSPIWDRVFGTFASKKGAIEVPSKYFLEWMEGDSSYLMVDKKLI